MIDKLRAAKTSEGARKKRQREINRDETRTREQGRLALTRQKRVEESVERARAHTAKIALEAKRGTLWIAGSGLPVSSSRASIGPLCHCQYSKEVQIIWWLMVHSRSHCIYSRVVRPRSHTDRARCLSSSFSLLSPTRPTRASSFFFPLSIPFYMFLFLWSRVPLNDPRGLFSLNFLPHSFSRLLWVRTWIIPQLSIDSRSLFSVFFFPILSCSFMYTLV